METFFLSINLWRGRFESSWTEKRREKLFALKIKLKGLKMISCVFFWCYFEFQFVWYLIFVGWCHERRIGHDLNIQRSVIRSQKTGIGHIFMKSCEDESELDRWYHLKVYVPGYWSCPLISCFRRNSSQSTISDQRLIFSVRFFCSDILWKRNPRRDLQINCRPMDQEVQPGPIKSWSSCQIFDFRGCLLKDWSSALFWTAELLSQSVTASKRQTTFCNLISFDEFMTNFQLFLDRLRDSSFAWRLSHFSSQTSVTLHKTECREAAQ